MHEIPKPQVLDPDRPLRHRGTEFTADERPRAELLDIALHESCGYAEILWDHLNAVRRYLLDSLPPDPRAPGPHRTAAASPTGPDDEQGWANWVNTFAAVSSALCGPQGDSGFGISRAREEAQLRRTAPVLTIAAEHPETTPPAPNPSRPDHADAHKTGPRREQGRDVPGSGRNLARSAVTLLLAALAVRGIRPQRHAGRTRSRS
jgi:hypothetical protein